MLAQAGGGVVSREELIARCWEGRIVGEDAITRCIARLRQIALAEPDGFEIRTLTRVGYQLVADSSGPPSGLRPALPRSEGELRPRRWRFNSRIAVLMLSALVLLSVSALWRVFYSSSPRWQIDQMKPLVTTEDGATSPALSPSGDLFAYSANGPDGVAHIYLRNLNGGERVQLTNGSGETMPKWLPAGGRLAFRASANGEPCHIMAITVPADRPRELVKCRYHGPQDYAFSPDGGALYYSDSDSSLAPDHLMRLDLLTGVRTPLTDHVERGVEDFVGEVSPSGRYLAFKRALGPTSNALMVFDLKGRKTKTIWQVQTDKWDAIAWLDDQTMLTAWRRADDRALVVVPLNGPRRRLTSATQAFYSLSRGKNDAFAAQTNFAVQSMVSLQPDGKQETRLSSEGLVADPAFAADGSLAFLADSAGELGLWIAKPGDKPVRIAGFGIQQVYHPAWSPDRKLISVTQVVDRVPHLRLLDIDGITRRDIALPGWDVGRSFWSPDGKQISIFGYDTPGNSLWHYDLATKRITRTALGEWSQVQMDGGAVYAVNDGVLGANHAIWRIFPDRRQITDKVATNRIDDWTVFHGQLYFVERVDAAHDRLIRQTLDGRILESRPIGVTPWLGGITVDPTNGRPSLVQLSGGRDDIYLLKTSR